MRMIAALAALLLVAFSTVTIDVSATPPSTFSYGDRIGVAELNGKSGFCLNVGVGTLEPGTPVTVIWATGRQTVTYATVERALEDDCALFADPLAFSYALRRVSGARPTKGHGIAVIRPSRRARVRRGVAELDVDGDHQVERFRICTSHEGLHLTVWTGRPLRGTRRWHQYYPLGFDVIPSCSPEEV